MILIIPDIHGRDFWNKAIQCNIRKADKVIFLGDYLDPYEYEGISNEDARMNFEEIIACKIHYGDKIVLLLGNHDLPYVDRVNFTSRSRYDSKNAYELEQMFTRNKRLFKVCHEETVANKKYLFSHSALMKQWCDDPKTPINEISTDSINKLVNTPEGMKALCCVPLFRGGWDQFGSIVWSDIRSVSAYLNAGLPWDYQVFGHTQQASDPVITDKFACLDCRRGFMLDKTNGRFKEC